MCGAWSQKEGNKKVIFESPSIKKIGAGWRHMVVLTKGGEVLVRGKNTESQLGLGEAYNMVVNDFTLIMKDESIKSITCGGHYTVVLKKDGTAVLWGQNYFGNLGLGDKNNRYTPCPMRLDKKVRFVACGGYHTIVYTEEKELWASGWNTKGELVRIKSFISLFKSKYNIILLFQGNWRLKRQDKL